MYGRGDSVKINLVLGMPLGVCGLDMHAYVMYIRALSLSGLGLIQLFSLIASPS